MLFLSVNCKNVKTLNAVLDTLCLNHSCYKKSFVCFHYMKQLVTCAFGEFIERLLISHFGIQNGNIV